MPTLTFPGRYESLAKIAEFVEKHAQQAGLDESASYAIQLAVDEACSNIIEHAYGGENVGEIQCTCKVTQKGLTVILRDQGQPFEPESVPSPDPNLPLEKVKPRGAGLYLIRNLMDEVTFKFTREAGNVLTLVKRRRK